MFKFFIIIDVVLNCIVVVFVIKFIVVVFTSFRALSAFRIVALYLLYCIFLIVNSIVEFDDLSDDVFDDVVDVFLLCIVMVCVDVNVYCCELLSCVCVEFDGVCVWVMMYCVWECGCVSDVSVWMYVCWYVMCGIG